MKVIHAYPPVYQAIRNHGMHPHDGVIYTYAGAIYNPKQIPLSDHLICHEETHAEQQERILPPQDRTADNLTQGADIWWNRYLNDPYFRIREESEAYGRQYAFMCETIKDRNHRARILHDLARILAGPVYGSVIGHQKAMQMIREHSTMR